jgi:hypothetical protein
MSKQIQIVATIGPSTREKDILKKIMEAGMSIARLNFSHGTHEEHGILINNIREASKELNTSEQHHPTRWDRPSPPPPNDAPSSRRSRCSSTASPRSSSSSWPA